MNLDFVLLGFQTCTAVLVSLCVSWAFLVYVWFHVYCETELNEIIFFPLYLQANSLRFCFACESLKCTGQHNTAVFCLSRYRAPH